ncbi:MAG TPA: Uma2 family endonuclease [Pyrinomonadaceae bacterium]|nr:Uma2 family endonuclease [Pyrinomonadaceae bacterium]
MTVEEYLALERGSEEKSEYLQGETFAMTGASIKHNLITGNIFAELKRQLRQTDCHAFVSDMRVGVPAEELYTYPDVVVVCGEPKLEDEYLDTLLNPVLIIEVLSKSTASYDRVTKFRYYRTIESLAEYLLVAQNQQRVEQYTKQPDGRWLLTDISSPESVVELASVGCGLRLKDIYERVEF